MLTQLDFFLSTLHAQCREWSLNSQPRLKSHMLQRLSQPGTPIQLDFNPISFTSRLTLLNLNSSCLFIHIQLQMQLWFPVCVCVCTHIYVCVCVLFSKSTVSSRQLIPTLARFYPPSQTIQQLATTPSPINGVLKITDTFNIFLKKLMKKICIKLSSKRINTMEERIKMLIFYKS